MLIVLRAWWRMLRLINKGDQKPARSPDEEALAWVVKLTSGQSTPADHEAFRFWRDSDPRHAEALKEARTLWTQLGTVLPVAAGRRARSARRMRYRLAVALPTAAVLLLGIGLGAQYWRVWRYSFVTGVGQTRDVTLPDGSQVMLGADTAIGLNFRKGERIIDLGRGEALFRVRHDASQPFTVRAGDVEVRDVGTIFDVDIVGAATQVVVAQGEVEASAGGHQLNLTAGRSVSVVDGNLGSPQTANVEMDTSWTRGWLELKDEPLSSVVEKISPYYAGQILLLDRSVSAQRLTVAINLSQIDDWIAALAKTHDVHVTRIGKVVVIW